ncbi:MAG: 4'-phosphopantetheinyl transferase family protein [Corynebacterium sp.]|uniref:4'-phosphopantetheinyl transferase family protein n=1 Tax=unclassified Corynebacterium TaxID=2624378 RepID=UPI003F905A1B
MIIAAPYVAVGLGDSDRAPVVPRDIVPPDAGLVEYHPGDLIDLAHYEELDDDERRIVGAAVDSRRSEFGDGRWCAHRALRGLGVDGPILRGDKGMPLFPDHVTGTISHTRGLRVALVARTDRWRSLGLDVEVAQRLPDGVLSAVSSARERRSLQRAAQRAPGRSLGTVLFSAKEAVYKAWFPVVGRFLDFDEVELQLDVADTFGAAASSAASSPEVGGRWHARVLSQPTPLPSLSGHWVIRDGYVVTVCAIPN